MSANKTKTYGELSGDLAMAAVQFTMAEREHARAVEELQRVRERLRAVGYRPNTIGEVDAASALERMARDALTEAAQAWKPIARAITEMLERGAQESGRAAERRRG